jgi:hypothetical protein
LVAGQEKIRISLGISYMPTAQYKFSRCLIVEPVVRNQMEINPFEFCAVNLTRRQQYYEILLGLILQNIPLKNPLSV